MINRLVKQAQKGDKEALLQLILDKQDDYYRLAWSYMKNKNDALDVMEDMIVILYEQIQTLRKREAFYSWSKKILVRCCYRAFREQKKMTRLADNQAELVTASDQVEQKHQELELDYLLAQLNRIMLK
ncbi:Sigma-70 region 2 [Amphibacillus marinus]|uniref:Sigma-70 region 2 n=1 Tax=Amphibacillus marinus TaxID=872970 RepID=A0A1H8IXQ9_9BACI|nr:Sigma-70 region 2 [Amphibacillus marinus]